jgi:hypothetical protein
MMSVLEYAAASGYTRQHVTELIRGGKIEAQRVGRAWVVLAAPRAKGAAKAKGGGKVLAPTPMDG